MTLNKDTLKIVLRKDFLYFLQKAFNEVDGSGNFLLNFHIEVIVREIHAIIDGETKRLLVNLPPRYLKSFIFSVAFVAYMLGVDPTLKFMCISYNQDLAEEFGLLTYKIMSSVWYKRLFPQTILDGRASSKTNFKTTKGGGRYATGIEGTITGRGADVIIVDDPIKPEEALSDSKRKKVNQWFSSTLSSRLNNKAKGVMICVMQRVHEDDLTGHLLNSSNKWKHLAIAAIAEQDEKWKLLNGKSFTRKKGKPLQPEIESLENLQDSKREMTAYDFASQYQQNPMSKEGLLLKKEWLQYYKSNELPQKPNFIILSWDTACEIGDNNDYSVCTIWFVLELAPGIRKYFLVDVIRQKLRFPDLEKKVIQTSDYYRNFYPNTPQKTLIEPGSSGIQLIQTLDRTGGRWYESVPIEGQDKIARFACCSINFEKGNVLLPEKASWLDDYTNELLRFHHAKHDDQVDSTSQALLWRRNKSHLDTSKRPNPKRKPGREYIMR